MKSEYDDVEEAPLLVGKHNRTPKHHVDSWVSVLAVIISSAAVLSSVLLAAGFVWRNHSPHSDTPGFNKVQKCSIDNLREDLSFLDNAKPIGAQEFLDRRDRLAKALAENGIDAFILEPGYTFQ